MQHFIETYGLAFLFVVIALESSGVPVPGETSLIAAAVLASQGHLQIAEVIPVAAVAAILGDNAGYWIGRTGGRKILYRWKWLARWSDRVLPPAERFFARHGGKTVFIARFVIGIRVTAAWMAGITHMTWWRFLVWNAAGGIAWAVAVGLAAFYAGAAAVDLISRYGGLAALGLVAIVLVGIGALHYWERHYLRR